MNKIDIQLEKIKHSGKIGLMTHVVIGYPTLQETEKIILALAEAGSDFIELQIPFSDPIADGPTIMQASDIALKNGVTAKTGMEIMKKMSGQLEIPLLFMCYFNTVFAYGLSQFCKDAAKAGAAGLIIPDVPPEEELYEKLAEEAEKYNLYLIRVISPASSIKRLQKNAQLSRGFVYCVSRFGVTGEKNKLAPEISAYLQTVKKYFNLPRAVGFGISKPEHVQTLVKDAEIAIVGSAIVSKLKEGESLESLKQFVSSLKQ